MPVNSFENYPMSWKPVLQKDGTPLYIQLSEQLRKDIADGRLLPGTKLPPQRELADSVIILMPASYTKLTSKIRFKKEIPMEMQKKNVENDGYNSARRPNPKESKYSMAAMLCGILGCFCYGGGDWLMIYGNPSYSGGLFWLTDGAADISAWRNALAMALAFPGIVLYGIALFYLKEFVKEEKRQKRYGALTAFGLTPWIALHLFYIMLLYLYAWLNHHGYADASLQICEALYHHLSWIVWLSEALMLPPFFYWFWLVLRGRTVLPKIMALVNPLVFYGLLSLIKNALPESAFRIGFTNGLMSESMILCFLLWAFWIRGNREGKNG